MRQGVGCVESCGVSADSGAEQVHMLTISACVSVPRIGLGLMLATALENNGAIVYIVGRRLAVLEQAAAERNVRSMLHLLTFCE